MSNTKDFATLIWEALPKEAQEAIKEKILADEAERVKEEQEVQASVTDILNHIQFNA